MTDSVYSEDTEAPTAADPDGESEESEEEEFEHDPLVGKQSHINIVEIPRDQFRSSDQLMLTEMTESLGAAAASLEHGRTPMIPTKGLDSSKKIAIAELTTGNSIYSVRRIMRTVREGVKVTQYVEIWPINSLALPPGVPTLRDIPEGIVNKAGHLASIKEMYEKDEKDEKS